MGRFKTEVDRTKKRLITDRVAKLEQKLKLHDAVLANLVRDQAEARVAAAAAAPSLEPTFKPGQSVPSIAEQVEAARAHTTPGGLYHPPELAQREAIEYHSPTVATSQPALTRQIE